MTALILQHLPLQDRLVAVHKAAYQNSLTACSTVQVPPTGT
jgi:hypothetical protein